MYRKDMHHDDHIYRGSFVYRLEGGVVRWIEGSDDHRLYSVDSLGNRSVDYVEVKDRNILDALADKKGVASYTSSTNIDDFFKVFLFSSDNSNVEWALHRGQDNSYTIGTSHKEGGVAAYSVLSKVDELPIASLYSHPDTSDLTTMGYSMETYYKSDQWKVANG